MDRGMKKDSTREWKRGWGECMMRRGCEKIVGGNGNMIGRNENGYGANGMWIGGRENDGGGSYRLNWKWVLHPLGLEKISEV